MPAKWCGKCMKVHAESCPKRKAWDNAGTPHKKRSGRGGRPWRRKRQQIFERDNFLCQIHLVKGLRFSVDLHGDNGGVCDHIKPLAEGGSDDGDNLQTICQSCDTEKTQAESLRGRGY